MAHDGIGRRLLAALAGSTHAFTPTGVTTDLQGAGHRLLAALAGSTPAFRSARDSDEYTSQPTKSVHRDAEDTDPKPSATDIAGLRRAAMHRTILVVDVEAFGDPRRTTAHQTAVRQGLYRVLQQAFEQAGVSWEASVLEDRGDGFLVLAPAEMPKAPFVDVVPQALVTALREHNTTHSVEERIRLRMALHAGEVAYDQHSVTSSELNLAFRLLDAAPLKTALAESSGVLAVITSGWFFDEVVRHSAASVAAIYRPVQFTAKDISGTAWISLPDHPYPSAPAHLTDPQAKVTAEVEDARPGSRNAIGGSWFRRFWKRSRVGAGAGSVRSRAAELEQAIRLAPLGTRRAEIDKETVEAVASLLRTIETLHQGTAVIRVGSMILIKTGDALVVRSIGETEAAWLERNSERLGDPVAMLKLPSAAKEEQEIDEPGAS